MKKRGTTVGGRSTPTGRPCRTLPNQTNQACLQVRPPTMDVVPGPPKERQNSTQHFQKNCTRWSLNGGNPRRRRGGGVQGPTPLPGGGSPASTKLGGSLSVADGHGLAGGVGWASALNRRGRDPYHRGLKVTHPPLIIIGTAPGARGKG